MSSKGPFWEPRAGKAAVGPAPKTTPLMQRTLPNFGEAEEEGDRLRVCKARLEARPAGDPGRQKLPVRAFDCFIFPTL